MKLTRLSDLEHCRGEYSLTTGASIDALVRPAAVKAYLIENTDLDSCHILTKRLDVLIQTDDHISPGLLLV